MRFFRPYYVLVGVMACLLTSCNQTSERQLPVFNPSDFNPKLVDISLQKVTENYTVSDFELINQNGETITQEDYKDKVYVVDFFFATCKTICPVMTHNMADIQNTFLDNKEIKFLSISVEPDADSVPVLRKYATDKGVIDTKWNVTTGNKKHIYNLARKSYFVVFEQGDGGPEDMIHTPYFILIDKKKQIRGFYDGTEDEDVVRLKNDLNILTD